MKVSVIIPNYNHALFLKDRIDSVLNQSFQDFELILLDDKSTDNSKGVIEQYKNHPKVSQIAYNEKNSGSVFKQWERGIQLARCKFIWIAESDDFADVNFLEKMVPVLQKNSLLGLVYCNSKIVSEEGDFKNETFSDRRNKMLNTSKWSESYYKTGRDEIKENLMRDCTINNASSVLFRKEALIKVRPFHLNFRYVGDWFCYVKICNEFDIFYLNEPLNFYREHKINTSINLKKDFNFVIEYFFFYDWVLKNIKFIDRESIKNAFTRFVRHSLFNKWTKIRFGLYKKMISKNPSLFWILIKFNLKATYKEKFFPKSKC